MTVFANYSGRKGVHSTKGNPFFHVSICALKRPPGITVFFAYSNNCHLKTKSALKSINTLRI